MDSKEVINYAGLTAGVALANLANTAVRDHRVYTHESLQFSSERIDRTARTLGAFLTDTKRWASVHLLHHSTPDANLVPFVELADFTEWREAEGDSKIKSIGMPEEIAGLDPAVKKIPIETALNIGRSARKMVEGLYKPKSSYTHEQANSLLHGQVPRYFYENQPEMKTSRQNQVSKKSNERTLYDIRFLLRDPHSPPLHREGVLGVLKYNVPLYGYVENQMVNQEFREEYLKSDELDSKLRENRALLRIGYVAGMIAASIAINKPKDVKSLVKHSVLGASASGLSVLALISGGNITNAFGHAGNLDEVTKAELLRGVVKPKIDGTYTTNNALLSAPTLDEVGGQEVHHDRPDKIAYTHKKGFSKFFQAPFGTVTEALASRNIGIKKGVNFFGNDHRPDEPSEAVLLLQEERARQLQSAA